MVFIQNPNEDTAIVLSWCARKPTSIAIAVTRFIRWSGTASLFAIFCADHKVRIFDHVSGKIVVIR
jgi:hypothetical protein